MCDNCVICRCEEVDLKEILDAINNGAHSIDEIKKYTRAGMGQCQGRICSTIITRILETQGFSPSKCPPPLSRFPVRAVNLTKYLEVPDNE